MQLKLDLEREKLFFYKKLIGLAEILFSFKFLNCMPQFIKHHYIMYFKIIMTYLPITLLNLNMQFQTHIHLMKN